jgi:hypothetical protein
LDGRREAMKSLSAPSFIFLLGVLLVFLGMTADQSYGELAFKAEISGQEEVPPVSTKAKGEAKFDLPKGGDQLAYRVVIEGIENVMAGHIHEGKKGKNGPPVADLFKEPKRVAVSGTLLSEGTIAAYELIGPLKGKPLQSLIQMMEAGDAYVNVHTKDHPEGEIRGQIVPGMKQESQPK